MSKVTVNQTEAAYRLVDGVGFECSHLDTETEEVESWNGETTSEVEVCLNCSERLETI